MKTNELMTRRILRAKRSLTEALNYGRDKNLDWVRDAAQELQDALDGKPLPDDGYKLPDLPKKTRKRKA